MVYHPTRTTGIAWRVTSCHAAFTRPPGGLHSIPLMLFSLVAMMHMGGSLDFSRCLSRNWSGTSAMQTAAAEHGTV